jgi:hypothetical protein
VRPAPVRGVAGEDARLFAVAKLTVSKLPLGNRGRPSGYDPAPCAGAKNLALITAVDGRGHGVKVAPVRVEVLPVHEQAFVVHECGLASRGMKAKMRLKENLIPITIAQIQ